MKSLLKLRILDKFILRQLLEVFILGVVVFTSIIFASDTFISLIKQISAYGMPVNIAFMIILLNLPAVIVMTIPMSVLFSTVMTVNKMCLQSEITVMKACGISIKRLSAPIFAFAIFMALFTFFINETIVPITTSQSKTLALYALVQRNIPEGKRNFSIKELKDGNYLKRLFYVEKCEDKQFSNVSILDLSEPNKVQILQAKTGTSVLEGWQFDNASVYTISKEGKTLNTSWIEKTIVDFGTDIQKQLDKKNDGSDLNFMQLLPYLGEKKSDLPPDVRPKYQICFWEKFSFPLITIVFVLIGIPLALTPPRVRHNRGFLFSIAIIFCYYIIRAFSVSLGYNGTISPFLAANIPVIIIGVTGFIMYKKKSEKI
ncbi:MAG: LptF/LptG family permease [Candidatus Gastranaerophilales bacterium]|nr:LptF/LptG family permease [Candidatus Gastranaerophilales bacterium]